VSVHAVDEGSTALRTQLTLKLTLPTALTP